MESPECRRRRRRSGTAPPSDLHGRLREIGSDEIGPLLLQVAGETTTPTPDLYHLEAGYIAQGFTRQHMPRGLIAIVLREVMLRVPAVVLVPDAPCFPNGRPWRRSPRRECVAGSLGENSLQKTYWMRALGLATPTPPTYPHAP